MRRTATAALLALLLVACSGGQEEAAPSPTPPPPSPTPTMTWQDVIDEVQDDYGFYGQAKDRYFEAIAVAFIDESCQRLDTIIDLWMDPPNYSSRYVRELPDDQRLELIGAAERGKMLLGCF